MAEKRKEPVKIILSKLKEQVEEGMKRKELAEYYGIPEMQMGKALKSAGLKIRKFHLPSFEIITEEEMEAGDERQMEIPFGEAESTYHKLTVEEEFQEIFGSEEEDNNDTISIEELFEETKEEEENFELPFNY